MQTDNNQQTTYICPMHPEVVSNQPGNCPKCGMTLVAQPGKTAGRRSRRLYRK